MEVQVSPSIKGVPIELTKSRNENRVSRHNFGSKLVQDDNLLSVAARGVLETAIFRFTASEVNLFANSLRILVRLVTGESVA